MSNGGAIIREMTIPRNRGATKFARLRAALALAITSLAVICLSQRVIPIISTAWLLFIALVVGLHVRGGAREYIVDCLGAMAGRQFVCSSTDGKRSGELTFGFTLFGYRFVQLRIPAEAITSVKWTADRATGAGGQATDDWTAWLWFDIAGLTHVPSTAVEPSGERGIWIVTASTPKDETESFGHSFVQFLIDAGARLIPDIKPDAFVRHDSHNAKKVGEASAKQSLAPGS